MKGSLESLVFNNPFEIIRTWWNLNPHQSNQNHNGKMSKAVEVQDTLYVLYIVSVSVFKSALLQIGSSLNDTNKTPVNLHASDFQQPLPSNCII